MTWLERSRGRFDGFSLDLKLGGRMLVKYPGLTLVGGLAMAFAIAVGAVIFEVVTQFLNPTLPLPNGGRIVQVRNWDVAANRAETRALYDFNVWRNTLQSITGFGAWRDGSRNLIVEGDARPVEVAEMTASGFRVADGTPLFGRVLVEDDERAGAAPVAVIGYNVWTSRFGSDASVVGRSVQLGDGFVTIVGVMRQGFAFPVSHDVWVPLRTTVLDQAPRSGPSINVFGVLAPGITLDSAQVELSTLGQRLATEQRATHEHLQPRVIPYAKMFFSDPGGAEGTLIYSTNIISLLLLVLICSNVALLLFARAATRETELIVRTALGASRARIVAQLFAEALVLGAVASVAGLLIAHVVLREWGVPFLEVNLGRLPFWFDLRLSPSTVLFALALTLLGSGIAGVMPALKVTRGMGSRLKQATAGAGGLQFGGVWTAVIVVQVAITVAFPALVYVAQWELRHIQTFDAGFPVDEYLAARIDMDPPAGSAAIAEPDRSAARALLGARIEELRRRVAADPGVKGVTFVDRLPRSERPEFDIELAGDVKPSQVGTGKLPFREATVATIEPSYFDVLETPIVAGRGFHDADLAPGANVAIVDQGFIDQVLEGRNPIGQQLRFAQTDEEAARGPNPWIEIVGVVKDLGMGTPTRKGRAAGLYVPVSPERFDRVYVMVHARGEPTTFGPELREIATAVDPTLRLSEIQRVDQVTSNILWIVGLWLRITMMMTAVALVLSLCGIYAVLSFIVARRTREIGLRVALGASRPRVVGAIFRRPLTQVATGIVTGAGLIALVGNMDSEMPGLSGNLSIAQFATIGGYAVLMFGICLLACIVPTRRALGVEPTVALRVD